MPRRSPNHRAVEAINSIDPPDDVTERALWSAYRGRLADDDNVVRAIELNAGSSRDCLRGWLLATPKDDEISRRTRVPEAVLQVFRYLFFDVSVFRDHFDLVEWAKTLRLEQGSTREGLQYIRWAIMYGVEAVAYMSGLPTNLDPHLVQAQAMTDGYFRALIGRESDIDSAVAREALKHQQIAVTQAAMLAKRNPSGGGSVAIKLKHREMTSTIEVIDKTTEVLH
jgi:hypothetical protein